jgi:predicted lipoprotein with Yx(FWY)xxD motif
MKKLQLAGAALAALLAASCGDGYNDDIEDVEEIEDVEDIGDPNDGDDLEDVGEDPSAMRTPDPMSATPGAASSPENEAATGPALTVAVGESAEYGQYLTDGDGRPLYIFTADTRAVGGADAMLACVAECLDAWPPAATGGAPTAGAGVDANLLGASAYEGGRVASYDGWPLYYFVRDGGGGAAPQGHEISSFGGEWYLVAPDGAKVGEGEEAPQ